jgi:hypothetical protein
MDVEEAKVEAKAIEVPKAPEKPKKVVKIRDARVYDIPQLRDMMVEFINWQRKLGNKIYTNGQFLEGGVTIELGAGFHNPMWKIIVAERDGIILGLLIGILEHCGPTEKFTNCVKIKADYMKDSSLARPIILRKMWQRLVNWGTDFNVGYYYGLIHPGNQPSIKAAKEVGFRHHSTQFLRLAQEED